MAQYGGEEMVGVARVRYECGNLLAVTQAEMGPGFTCVARAIDPVAYREVRPLQSLATGHVDDVRIGRRYGNCADRLGRLLVEYGGPGATVVIRLPYAAVDLTDVEHIGL